METAVTSEEAAAALLLYIEDAYHSDDDRNRPLAYVAGDISTVLMSNVLF